jgi:hypothetical protein
LHATPLSSCKRRTVRRSYTREPHQRDGSDAVLLNGSAAVWRALGSLRAVRHIGTLRRRRLGRVCTSAVAPSVVACLSGSVLSGRTQYGAEPRARDVEASFACALDSIAAGPRRPATFAAVSGYPQRRCTRPIHTRDPNAIRGCERRGFAFKPALQLIVTAATEPLLIKSTGRGSVGGTLCFRGGLAAVVELSASYRVNRCQPMTMRTGF